MHMAPKRNWLLRTFWRFHRWAWRITNGRFLRRIVGMPVLELVALGRKSGEPRSVLLSYLPAAGDYVVIASNAGDDREPAWLLNLRAEPAARVRCEGTDFAVMARELDGPEYDQWWERAVVVNRDYVEYAARTDRPIALVRLEKDLSQ